MYIIQLINTWIIFPIVLWLTLRLAKLSGKEPLNKWDLVSYTLGVTVILLRGIF